MKLQIKHKGKNRIRIHLNKSRMSYEEADRLQYWLEQQPNVVSATVYERTCDAVIKYESNIKDVLNTIEEVKFSEIQAPEEVIENSGRALNAEYKEKIICQVMIHYGKKLLLPAPIRAGVTAFNSIKFIKKGIQCLLKRKIEVPVLDASAIAVSLLRGNFNTASSVMFLLEIGETLEEWTHKKSVDDLARSMSLTSEKVWVKKGEQKELIDSKEIMPEDQVIVHMGNVIPFDGAVLEGEAMVNQASMTGESLPVRKAEGSTVYAGTVVEEGEITFLVKETRGNTRYEKIVSMLEDTQKLKSASESRAEHMADKLVPYTLLGTILTYAITRNATKALAVLMVDFSCALKLATPVTVLSAIREAGDNDIMVKGGKYMEAVADATTIVFDKTGTLTKATPTVNQIVTFGQGSEDTILRIAACLEEHFPHSMAKAVVDAAKSRGLTHDEMHSKVEYVVAHGIASSINGHRVIIGSYHFVFEDEGAVIPDAHREKFDALTGEYSQLYLAVNGVLAAVICIEDPLRQEAVDVIRALKQEGINKVVMMTGDSEKTAASIAKRVGVDEYYAEVLPEDKASFVDRERAAGNKVIMVGDGINDSPALSAANVGIAISDGAEIAREIADITIKEDDLNQLVILKRLSNMLMNKLDCNYKKIVGINGLLIGLGVLGFIQPTTSAMIHNVSTLAITCNSMKDML